MPESKEMAKQTAMQLISFSLQELYCGGAPSPRFRD